MSAPPETTTTPTNEAVAAALATVNDPEIRRPITELGMVKAVDIAADGSVLVGVFGVSRVRIVPRADARSSSLSRCVHSMVRTCGPLAGSGLFTWANGWCRSTPGR